MEPTRVVIVDDQMLCREGLRELMGHWDEFKVVGEAANGREALEVCRKLKPDMVLMDVQMPVMDGVEATREISHELPDIAIIMLTVAVDDQSLFGALQNGARGYVLKDTPSKELRAWLRRAAKGESPLSGLVATRMIREINEQGLGTGGDEGKFDFEAHFTPREIDILKLVAQGYSNVEISSMLYLGAGTVKKHLSSIMQKLGLENRVQVATFAYRSGLMD